MGAGLQQLGLKQGSESRGGEGRVAARAQLTRRSSRCSNITFYSLTPTSDSPVIALSSILSHQSVPLPAALPQTADSIALFWMDDLLSPLAYLSPAERAKVSDIKVRVKTPSPRILDVQGPEGFETVRSQGAAGVTFLAPTAEGLGPQVRPVLLLRDCSLWY